MKETFKKILVLDNEIDANLMKEELSKRNIPHIIRSYHDSAYDGLFQMQKGWGIIKAPAEFEAEISRIHQDIKFLKNKE
ncbi:MAG: hypothetical protein DRZ79_03820 [Candidatus Cloacimonadota bacterium]|nr:MAG: hypothetical protein DRZ79_03820 [Candidatus Cloacimonadota bacterium]